MLLTPLCNVVTVYYQSLLTRQLNALSPSCANYTALLAANTASFRPLPRSEATSLETLPVHHHIFLCLAAPVVQPQSSMTFSQMSFIVSRLPSTLLASSLLSVMQHTCSWNCFAGFSQSFPTLSLGNLVSSSVSQAAYPNKYPTASSQLKSRMIRKYD